MDPARLILAAAALLAACESPATTRPRAAATPAPAAPAQQEAAPAAPATRSGEVAPERLIAPVPRGWVLGASNLQPRVQVQEILPAGQPAGQWTDIITILKYPGQAEASIAQFQDALTRSFIAACEVQPASTQPQEMDARGYQAGFHMIACPRTKRRGDAEVVMYKTIKGEDAVYQVQRAWRLPATDRATQLQVPKESLDGAAAYLRTVYVCDARRADRPCPRGM